MSVINKMLFSVIMLLSCTSLCAMKRPSSLFGRLELPKKKKRCVEKSFFCSIVECERHDKPLKSKAALQSHEALKHSICPDCPNLEPFQDTGELVQHCKLMKHVHIFCSICEKYIKVSQRTTLQNHEKKCGKNSNPRGVRHFCSFDWCPKNTSPFRSPSELRFHLLTQHNICFHCLDQQGFDSRQLLIEHYEQMGHSADFCQHCKNFITLPGSVIRLNAHRNSCEKRQKRSRELPSYKVLEFSLEDKENIANNGSSLLKEDDLCALFTTNFDERITKALKGIEYFDSGDSISEDYLNDVLSEKSSTEITR